MKYLLASMGLAIILSSFAIAPRKAEAAFPAPVAVSLKDSTLSTDSASMVESTNQFASNFVEFAKTLIGTKYVWGSVNPKIGVDCSGFVNYVSKHFGMTVPRTAASFTHLGTEVTADEAQTGDLILFTGSNAKKRKVGHMGIITDNEDGDVSFIHSSSGHARGVHISELKGYYKIRMVKIIRIFPLTPDKIVG
jgi:cell wall-associated NlpC family hydrolase